MALISKNKLRNAGIGIVGLLLFGLFQNFISAINFEDRPCLDNSAQLCRYYNIPAPRGKINGVTLNDAPIIQTYLDDGAAYSLNNPNVKVVFDFPLNPIGTAYDYFLLGTANRFDQLSILRARNIIFDAKNANFNISTASTFLFVGYCQNCEFKNFTYDNLVLPFTQGKVVAIDAVNKTLNLQVHAGYPLRDYNEIDINLSAIGKKDSLAIIYNETDALNSANENLEYPTDFVPHFRVIQSTIIDSTKRIVQLKVDPDQGSLNSFSNLKTFNLLAVTLPVQGNQTKIDTLKTFLLNTPNDFSDEYLVGSTNGNIFIEHSSDVRFMNITQYSAPGMSVFLSKNDGKILFDNFNIRRKLSSAGLKRRLLAGNSDGFHVLSNKIGPTIRNGYFEGLGDDIINLSSSPFLIQQVLSSNEIKLLRLDRRDRSVNGGDKLYFFDPLNGKGLGEYTVVTTSLLADGYVRASLDLPLPATLVTFVAGAFNKNAATRVFNLNDSNTNYEIANNRFYLSVRNGILARYSGSIHHNIFADLSYGVSLSNHEFLGQTEGSIPVNVSILNNFFVRVAKDNFRTAVLANQTLLQRQINPPEALISGISSIYNYYINPRGHTINVENVSAASSALTGAIIVGASDSRTNASLIRSGSVTSTFNIVRSDTTLDKKMGEIRTRLCQ